MEKNAKPGPATKFIALERVEVGWGETPTGDGVVFIRPTGTWEGKPLPAMGVPYQVARQLIGQLQTIVARMDLAGKTGR
jgi:hypothetical protein